MLYFATGNINKFNEVRELIPELSQLNIETPEIQSMDLRETVSLKLKSSLTQVKDSLIVDDTGLYLECLNGFPGPMIKHLLGTIGAEGIYNLVSYYGKNRAIAQTLIGFADKEGQLKFFEGSVEGTIVKPSGVDGFGWDSIFLPDGYTETYAQMRLFEKNRMSHRFKAIEGFKQYYHSLS